jgi:DNA (cytosine-5)-methyltransferase 1
MKFIELFAGIGAFRLGLENTGHQCVYSNEWLEKPRRIYERNFGDKPDSRDIRLISADELPDADIIVGGFPCATFSYAGKRTGFSLEDTRGTLAFEMFRLARDKGIPYILFENVKGLLNHDSGRTFGIILSVLDAMGYDCQWELLDSQNFGVPQHRERIFLIANLRGKPRPKVFPIGRTGEPNVKKNARESKSGEGVFSNISPTLDAHYSKGGASRQYVAEENPEITVAQWRRGYFREYKSNGVPTLTANMGTGGHNVPFVTGRNPREIDVFPTIDGHYWKGIQNNQGRGAVKNVRAVLTVNREEKRQNGRRFKEVDEASFTITAQDRHGVMIEDESTVAIRKLTPLECERLQGFPDNFTKYYEDGSLVSDSERYERCGRTITIPVVEAIGRKLHEFY